MTSPFAGEDPPPEYSTLPRPPPGQDPHAHPPSEPRPPTTPPPTTEDTAQPSSLWSFLSFWPSRASQPPTTTETTPLLGGGGGGSGGGYHSTIGLPAPEPSSSASSSSSSPHDFRPPAANVAITIPPSASSEGESANPTGTNPDSPLPPPYTILDDAPPPPDELPNYADVAESDPLDEEWLEEWGGWVLFAFFVMIVVGTAMLPPRAPEASQRTL
ncbi:hypothetical protein HDU96_007251 [Phlyctochytrium bullatum]|nr:hypothetical protein HDU96_007251 [Phlyctochytrium bullatum]